MQFFIVLPFMSSTCRALCLNNAVVMWYKPSTDQMSNTWESSFVVSCKCLICLTWEKVHMASITLYIFLMHFFIPVGKSCRSFSIFHENVKKNIPYILLRGGGWSEWSDFPSRAGACPSVPLIIIYFSKERCIIDHKFFWIFES